MENIKLYPRQECLTSASSSFACRSVRQLKAVLGTFIVAPYANRYAVKNYDMANRNI